MAREPRRLPDEDDGSGLIKGHEDKFQVMPGDLQIMTEQEFNALQEAEEEGAFEVDEDTPDPEDYEGADPDDDPEEE